MPRPLLPHVGHVSFPNPPKTTNFCKNVVLIRNNVDNIKILIASDKKWLKNMSVCLND